MINNKKHSTLENEIVENGEQEEEEEQEQEGKSENLYLTENETSWMRDIDNSNIKNDLEFTFCIGIFVEAVPEYYGVMEMFNEAAVYGARWEIKVISKEYIRSTIHNNLRSNKYKPFKQLCTQIISYAGYDLEGKIPTKLLAYFIMYEIRRLKNVYNQMKLYKVEIEEEKLKRLEQAFNYDSSNAYKDELRKTKESTINYQDKNSVKEVYGIRRPESELSTRLEERDLRFIEDHPLAGPQVYIAITTIYDPQLPTELIEVLGVPVHCVVKVGNDSKKVGKEDNTNEKNSNQNILQQITNYYYRKKRNKRRPFHPEALNEQKRTDISNFWSGLISKIQHPEKTSFYALTTLAIYTPSIDKIDLEKKNWQHIFKKLLYNEICCVMYNQYDLNVLYQKYMSSMEVTNLDPLGKCKLENMSVYNGILQNIPNESINIPIIFDSIIAQISTLFGEESGYEDVLAKQKENKTYKKQSLVTNLKELNLIHDVLTIKDNLNDYKPRTILYGDTARLKSYHLGETGKFITHKTFHILSLQYKNLFQNTKRNINEENRKQHMHVFRNVIGIRDRKKLSELLLLLAIIDRNPFGPNFHRNNQTIENGDDSRDINTQYLIEDALNCMKKTKNNQNHTLIQNLNAIEEMHPEVLVQTLYKMSITHNTIETKYIPLLDGFLFKFYNCPKNYYKTCVMQTPITLRDFVKYSLPEEKEWANLSLIEFQKTNVPQKFPSDLHLLKKEIIDPIDPPIKVTPILLIDSDSFFSVPARSLKKDEEQSESSNDWDDEEKYSEVKKSKKSIINESKDVKHKQTVSKIYNVGPGKRLQFYARTIEAMFRHGTKIRIHFHHQLYEKKMMSLELQTSGHRIYYSSSLTVNEDPIKLQIHHRSGIILSFQQKESKKYTARFTKLTKLEDFSDSEADTMDYTDKDSQHEKDKNSYIKEKYHSTIHENDSITIEKAEELERCQIKSSPHPFINRLSTFSFSASWPSGYYMECNTLPNTHTVYIKHSYLTKGPSCKLIENELYRLNLPNNNVIKFLNNKTFEILFPTGKKIICQKYFWRKIKTQKREVRTQTIYEKVKREIVPILYKIFHTDGRVELFKNGTKKSETNIKIRNRTDILNDFKVSEMANGTTIVQKNDASQIVEFNDGTRFTTVVQITSDEIFCDWSLEEKLKWFQGFSDFLIISDMSDIDHPPQEVKNISLKKGILENEGYINITKTVFIEHPNFSTTYNCSETKSTIIRFPMSTTIYIYSNGTYDIKFATGTNIAIKKDRFIIDKFLNYSLFQHTVIMPHALKFNDIPDPPLIQFLTSDIHGNELKIDTTNFIHYRYALSKKHKFCLKHLTDNVNYFFLRRDLSGMEIFPHCRLAKIKEINRKVNDSYVQEFWNTPFKDAIFLSPTETASDEWIMPYSAPIAPVVQNVPSTYGKSWVFPFDLKQRSYFNTPKTLTMRVIKTFICENVHKKIVELIEEYKNTIDNKIKHPKCKCHKVRPWEHISFDNVQDIASILYKHGNIIIKTPDESFINYVKEYIVLHAARVAIKERKISKIIERYQNQKSAILKKRIPPYFASCFGIAYLLTKEIRDKTNRAIEQMEYSSILDVLLNKKINLVTENDIKDITRLLKMLKSDIWKDQDSVQNILNTGKELQDNFNNMREVLKYHLGANLSNDSQDIV